MGRCRRWLPAAAKGSLRAAINVLLLLRARPYRWCYGLTQKLHMHGRVTNPACGCRRSGCKR